MRSNLPWKNFRRTLTCQGFFLDKSRGYFNSILSDAHSHRSHFKLPELCDVLRPSPRFACVEDGVFLRPFEKICEEIMEDMVYPATHDVFEG